MNFSDWQDRVPPSIREDTLWDLEVYRLSLFASDVCWQDMRKIHEESNAYSLADQLYRAVGSISSNIAEGYSRGTGKDRARFYEYPSALRGKAETGTTKVGLSLGRTSWIIVSTS